MAVSAWVRKISGSRRKTASRMLTTIRTSSTTREVVMEPVCGLLKASMAKMKAIPETCPISRSRPLEVPSGTGWVTSAK